MIESKEDVVAFEGQFEKASAKFDRNENKALSCSSTGSVEAPKVYSGDIDNLLTMADTKHSSLTSAAAKIINDLEARRAEERKAEEALLAEAIEMGMAKREKMSKKQEPRFQCPIMEA